MIEHPHIDADVGLSNSRSRGQLEVLVVVLRITPDQSSRVNSTSGVASRAFFVF